MWFGLGLERSTAYGGQLMKSRSMIDILEDWAKPDSYQLRGCFPDCITYVGSTFNAKEMLCLQRAKCSMVPLKYLLSNGHLNVHRPTRLIRSRGVEGWSCCSNFASLERPSSIADCNRYDTFRSWPRSPSIRVWSSSLVVRKVATSSSRSFSITALAFLTSREY